MARSAAKKKKRRVGRKQQPLSYLATPDGLVRLRPGEQRGKRKPETLTNFVARIVENVEVDDGVTRERYLRMLASVGRQRSEFMVPASRFSAMAWPINEMGPAAIIYPGKSDHARAAIQFLSRNAPTTTEYAHTGWRVMNGAPAYLHAGGAIGAGGPVKGVRVRAPDGLTGYALPDPPPVGGEDLVRAVRASLAMLNLAPATVAFPLFCAIWRAPLGPCDGSLFIAGQTGLFKSELAALCQQHYGAALDRLHLPGNWSSTENALELLAFLAKDALLVIDDFVPTGTRADVARQNQKAERVLRAQGNRSGRQRMGGGAGLLPARPPRGLILSTGEDVPPGASLGARMLVVEVGPSDVDPHRLTACQEDARQGLYAAAMSGYVRWLAGQDWFRRDCQDCQDCQVFSGVRDQVAALRKQVPDGGLHARTPDLVANLAAGLHNFLSFAEHFGVTGADEAQKFWDRGWNALTGAARKQGEHQAASDSAAGFLDLLRSAVASGRAHVAAPA